MKKYKRIRLIVREMQCLYFEGMELFVVIRGKKREIERNEKNANWKVHFRFPLFKNRLP